MPGSELIAWRAYFEIYPFTFDRDDWRHAELMTAVINDGQATRAQAAGKRSFSPVKVGDFLIDYLPDEVTVKDPKQRAQYAAFKAQLADAKARAGVT